MTFEKHANFEMHVNFEKYVNFDKKECEFWQNANNRLPNVLQTYKF